MSTEEENFLALVKESLSAHQGSAPVIINYTCYNAPHSDYVETLHIAINGDGRINVKQAGSVIEQPREIAGSEPAAVILPDELATDEAMRLWKKLQDAGYVDANYQPLVSRTMAAMIADAIATHLGIQERRWKVFEDLWHRRGICSDYARAFNQQQAYQFQDILKNLIN